MRPILNINLLNGFQKLMMSLQNNLFHCSNMEIMSKMINEIAYHPIGFIETPFNTSEGMPIQASFSHAKGIIHLRKEFHKALKGLEDFSHIILLYHFNKARDMKLQVKPFLSKEILGIFAVRAPNRPNNIGISVVRLKQIKSKNDFIEIQFEGADMLNGTPLLDIKPYVMDFDSQIDVRNGWYDERDIETTKSDNRFTND